jgi:hypothetical protein
MIKMLQALEEDWFDAIMLTKQYFVHLSTEMDRDNVKAPLDWTELREAWIELKMYEDLYKHYKELILKDEVDAAVIFAENILESTDSTVPKKYYELLMKDM